MNARWVGWLGLGCVEFEKVAEGVDEWKCWKRRRIKQLILENWNESSVPIGFSRWRSVWKEKAREKTQPNIFRCCYKWFFVVPVYFVFLSRSYLVSFFTHSGNFGSRINVGQKTWLEISKVNFIMFWKGPGREVDFWENFCPFSVTWRRWLTFRL